jgi:hypothetical protein
LCCEIKGSSLLFWVARCQWVQNRDGTVPSCFSTCVCVYTQMWKTGLQASSDFILCPEHHPGFLFGEELWP